MIEIKVRRLILCTISAILFSSCVSSCGSGNVDTTNPDISRTVVWDAPSTGADGTALSSDGIGGYKIYYGTSSENYTDTIDVGKGTTYTFSSLSNGTYYVAVTVYDINGVESDYSNEVVKVIQ